MPLQHSPSPAGALGPGWKALVGVIVLWVLGWFALGELDLLPATTLGYGLIPLFASAMALLLVGLIRVIYWRVRAGKALDGGPRAAMNGWAFAGFACLLVGLCLAVFDAPSVPDGLPASQQLSYIYPGMSHCTLLLTLGITMIAAAVLARIPSRNAG